jgi:tRNA pseudouridine55 synthase
VRTAPWRHVTREIVEDALSQFRGEIQQAPPMYVHSRPPSFSPPFLPLTLAKQQQKIMILDRFSALKMDGMPLYEYARKGIPLPRPIEKRQVTVHSLELVEWKGDDHPYRWPEKAFSDVQKRALEQSLSGVDPATAAPVADDDSESVNEADREDTASDEVPTAFVLQMRVSGGTYVRSIVHDLAHALGSAGHVVTLTRSRQKDYVLEPTEEGDRRCVPWEVFEAALKDAGEKDADGWTEWEREVLDKLAIVDGSGGKS